MHQQHDPKIIIEKANAEAKIKKLIADAKGNIGKLLQKHRGRVTMMLNDGTIKTGVIKLGTQLFILFNKNGNLVIYGEEEFFALP